MDVEAVRGVVYGVVRRTFYEHFCAGETGRRWWRVRR
ncbi:hypothetical protein LINPERPRIM_LOCUS4936 [Linum perenne]